MPTKGELQIISRGCSTVDPVKVGSIEHRDSLSINHKYSHNARY